MGLFFPPADTGREGNNMHERTQEITDLIVKAGAKARREVADQREPELTQRVRWPVACTVGPGLEGAIACETKIAYVNGTKGWLIYRGYDIFDLCAQCTFEEVSYLLLHGDLPTAEELDAFNGKLVPYRHVPKTHRLLMSFPVEKMNTMAALRLGTNLMRQEVTYADHEVGKPDLADAISADEDSIPMETAPVGEKHAIYEFKRGMKRRKPRSAPKTQVDPAGLESCYHLISGVASIAAAIARIRQGHLPIEADPDLSHAANFIYMMTGRRPSPVQERIMDVALILHADHGMNASTFAAMVVASTQSDMYFATGSGIAALNGPLHGGANEQVVRTLREIGDPANVKDWYHRAMQDKQKVVGFGHRVYKAYDPRARVLAPLVKYLVKDDVEVRQLFRTAKALEHEVVTTLGAEKGVFPNVDFYSGLVYACLGIASEMFTPVFAVSRVSGWTARIMEYMKNNRIFRPRAMYAGPFNRQCIPIDQRAGKVDDGATRTTAPRGRQGRS